MNLVDTLFEAIDRGREGKSQGDSIGLPKLEQVIDGVCKGVYYLIGGESGTGKSSLMLYSFVYRPLMDHLNDDNLRISLFSLEMNCDKVLAKLLSTYIFEKYNKRLSVKQLLSAQKDYILSDENYAIVQECRPWLDNVASKLVVYDKNVSANSIYSHLLKELEERGTFKETDKRKIYIPNNPDLLHIVITDHLARVFPAQGATIKQEMDLTSKYLYSLKNRCNITPVVLQQLNRGIQSMDRRKESMVVPLTSDFKDSGSSQEDAEIILAIFSPNKAKMSTHNGYDIKQLGDKFRSIFVLKSRYGEGDVEDCIYYDGSINRWTELPRANEINDYGIFNNPNWYKDNTKGIEYIENKDQSNQKPKFIL